MILTLLPYLSTIQPNKKTSLDTAIFQMSNYDYISFIYKQIILYLIKNNIPKNH